MQRVQSARQLVTLYRHERFKPRRRLLDLQSPISVDERKTHQVRRLVYQHVNPEAYSGETSYQFSAAKTPGGISAETVTSAGEQYSRQVTYHRTNAIHRIRLSLTALAAARRTGVPASIDGNAVVSAVMVRDGIFELIVIRIVGKQISLAVRFSADQGDGQWHLAKTERGAVTALNRAKRHDAESAAGIISGRTVSGWGWCRDGVRQWCHLHGITRDVKRRLRRGASSRAIARLILRHGGAKTGYDRRLLTAAGID